MLENAVASFFTPTSSKPHNKIAWTERAPDRDTASTLLVGKYQPLYDSTSLKSVSLVEKRRKIVAFDFVSYSGIDLKLGCLSQI